jgi:hypothetical protein
MKMVLKDFLGLVACGRKALGLGLMIAAFGGPAFAGEPAPAVPEIDAGSMVSAVALLSGAVLVVTNRVRRK